MATTPLAESHVEEVLISATLPTIVTVSPLTLRLAVSGTTILERTGESPQVRDDPVW